ncbi:MAG: PSD1 and planctomycete cytochrome C domain-containing protein [Bryobacterales bacterium]|nr:PSD1 and planctomycete cytochrome C domain-containing protein [Bryobacterales bacterium]MDE0265201.1 PSD1 and planctomycete cytochrome C domain-containing protein [Bryobacterales bacterium]
MPSSFRIAAYWTVFAAGAGSMPAVATAAVELPPVANRIVDFAADVQPILHTRCYACHGPSVQMNGLRLDRRDAARKGGHSGLAIVPNDSAGSALILRIASPDEGFRMPPVDPRLSREEVGILRAWIDQGASWPEDSEVDAAIASASASEHWAFQPITRPEPPRVRGDEWVRNPIDRFVLAKLESEAIDPSPAADKLTILRRLSLDLIGLPPTWEQAEAFLGDSSPGAYERLVDALLDSKHYGEKWARHWLDLARYADSDGYEKDLARPSAWRWREWVIEALNRDLPFDEFTKLQLAADLLENPTPDQLAATGFHRNTLRNREGGTIYDQSRFEETLDRVNTVATTWLGLTVECAQCHDHKYDPITQEDFYSFYAYFDNLEDTQIDAPLPGEMGPYLRARAEYLRKRKELLEEHHVPDLQPEWERQMKIAGASPGERTDWDLCYDVLFQMTDNGGEVLNKDPAERTFREREVLTDYFIDWYFTVVPKERIEQLGFKELRKKLKELKSTYPQLSEARIIRERDKPSKTFLRVRGQWDRQGIEVAPRPPSFLPDSAAAGRATRLDLAEWILSTDNPLTARVAVNRMWQEFFGRGLARTSEDFGLQGEAPSHPALLDWLASEFRSNGWRMKRMHRSIVMSATYRQTSHARPDIAERDPDNAWLSRQNRIRLSAEILRDSALRVSGLLYPKIGGPSVYPPQPAGVVDLTYGWDTDRWKDSEGADRYRRGLYTFFQRTAPYPQLMNFDAPDSNRTASRRRRSNTPLQALNLLNDEVFVESARALAIRVLAESPPDWTGRLSRMFQMTLVRKPRSGEAEQLAESFRRQQRILKQAPDEAKKLARIDLRGHEATEVAAWVGIGRVLMNTDEFITRE